MSETPPVSPNANRPARLKRNSLVFWIASVIGTIIVLVMFATPCSYPFTTPEARNSGHIRKLRSAILMYAKDHNGNLPPNLWALTDKYIGKTALKNVLYLDDVMGKGYGWLYFPHEKLDGLPQDTIILASSGITSGPPPEELRRVWQVGSQEHFIPEADFQRLIREQNPPAASPPPDRQKTVQ